MRQNDKIAKALKLIAEAQKLLQEVQEEAPVAETRDTRKPPPGPPSQP